MDDLKEIVNGLREARISIESLEGRFKDTDAQIQKSDLKFKELYRQLADIGFSNGDAAENYFFNSLEESKKLGGVQYDEITKNIKQKRHRIEDEYDIFLENGSSVGIIEVKYKVNKAHIQKLKEQKVANFRILFPDYTDYKLYIGIAGFSYEAGVEQEAVDCGFVVLKQKGDLMEVNHEGMRAF
jgi:hypothetical protein